MNKKITISEKKEVASGFGANNKSWRKFEYITDDGKYYMFDDLEVGKSYEIESYPSKGKDGKEYTNWRIPRQKTAQAERIDEVLKLVKWLVVNHPAYQPKQEKPEGNPPY